MTERRPHWVYEVGDEPDPRYTLANERPVLAWVRTGLAVLAGAVALDSIGVPSAAWLRTVLVAALVLSGAAMTVLAYVRWARVERAMRTRTDLPAFGLGLAVTVGVVVVAVLLAGALTLS